MNYLLAYAASLLAMLGLDALWLGLIAKSLYRSQIGHLMAAQVQLLPALAFYAVYAIGIVYLVVMPTVNAPWRATLIAGAVFGLCAYATYNLTNLATLRDWPLQISLIDMTAGMVVTTIAASAGRAVIAWLGR